MTEEQILSALINYCQDDTLIFQIIIHSTTLHIYINRQEKAEVNYNQLKNTIFLAISSLKIFNLEQIYLYSRTIGKIKLDWEATIDYKQSNIIQSSQQCEEQKSPNNINNDSNEDNFLENKHIIFKTYCFIRNKNLLTSELLPPKFKVNYSSKINKYLSIIWLIITLFFLIVAATAIILIVSRSLLSMLFIGLLSNIFG